MYEVNWHGERAVVKDFSKTPFWFRMLVAPCLVRREMAALRWLQGTPGIPKFLGRVDRLAFALQYIEGTPIATYSLGELPDWVFPRIQAVIDGMHERGVSHCDLKRRSNLLLTPEGEIYLVDFAAAVIGGRPLHPFANWLQREMARVDDKSVPRLKKFVAPELLTEEDKHKLATPTGLEKLAKSLLKR